MGLRPGGGAEVEGWAEAGGRHCGWSGAGLVSGPSDPKRSMGAGGGRWAGAGSPPTARWTAETKEAPLRGAPQRGSAGDGFRTWGRGPSLGKLNSSGQRARYARYIKLNRQQGGLTARFRVRYGAFVGRLRHPMRCRQRRSAAELSWRPAPTDRRGRTNLSPPPPPAPMHRFGPEGSETNPAPAHPQSRPHEPTHEPTRACTTRPAPGGTPAAREAGGSPALRPANRQPGISPELAACPFVPIPGGSRCEDHRAGRLRFRGRAGVAGGRPARARRRRSGGCAGPGTPSGARTAPGGSKRSARR